MITGCRTERQSEATAVATIEPIAAIVEPVVGSDVTVMLSPGASPHTYDPKPSDVRTAASASVLFFASEDLDAWAADLDLHGKIGLLSLVPDSLLLGSDAHPDPHFWLDPLTVQTILPALADTLCVRMPQDCDSFRQRAADFAGELSVVHDSVSTLMKDVRGATVLVAHPFLGYFARRYGLSVGGVVEEIPGSEATPKDVMRLIEQAEASSAEAILTLPQHPSRAAEAVAEATGIPIVELDPIGGGANGYQDLLYFNAGKIHNAIVESAPER